MVVMVVVVVVAPFLLLMVVACHPVVSVALVERFSAGLVTANDQDRVVLLDTVEFIMISSATYLVVLVLVVLRPAGPVVLASARKWVVTRVVRVTLE